MKTTSKEKREEEIKRLRKKLLERIVKNEAGRRDEKRDDEKPR
jgi:hypothetical protein